MKIYAYILIVLSGVLTAQCSKVTLDEICGYPRVSVPWQTTKPSY